MGLDDDMRPGDRMSPAGHTCELRKGAILTQEARLEAQIEIENRHQSKIDTLKLSISISFEFRLQYRNHD